ncbi:MAG: nuclease, partial [Gemmatimonadota bacterium]
LRDCAPRMPMVFADQCDLFAEPRHAACPRHAFGFCSGPCAGFVAEWDYRRRVETAAAFFEGRTIQPIDRVVAEMQQAAGRAEFELAARWREKFEALEWMLAATARARVAIDLLSFVYRDPGIFGDDRAYVVRRGVVRAAYPWPETPIEREAFRAVVAAELAREEPGDGTLPIDAIDEVLLVMSWFRNHPEALRRTAPLAEWA